MKTQLILGTLAASLLLGGCPDVENAASKMTEKAAETTKTVAAGAMEKASAGMAELTPGADLSALPAGTYKSEQGHAYIAFTYSHQGYSKPILRWRKNDATVVYDAENPENSTLTVTIPVDSIDSGVDKFDEHLVSADFFDAANHPTITFTSTDINKTIMGGGKLTGNLTIKGVTKPITLTGKVNKVGKNFRSGVDMFGVSATGSLKRSDFGVDKYAPMADDVDLMIEVEFQKAE